jgi:pimeloyl-ACP methyl ester carboxylesterase
VHTLADPPAAAQISLFNQVYGNDVLGLLFYETLLSDPSLRYFLTRAYYDPSLITDTLLDEYRAARPRWGQRWISFAFVGGQFFRKFAEVIPAATLPVLAIFGKEAKSPAPGVAPDTAADFSALAPHVIYAEVEKASLSVQREQPEAVAKLILDFVK